MLQASCKGGYASVGWRVSISMDVAFCIEALEEALARYGKPTIFNSDQGSQFTSAAFWFDYRLNLNP
ncbi:hypothetical protein SPHINGO391_520051 [Sphingomonas aurantiaca]|uniref:Integrase catalytic domain-containing protein n=1 Tax=Sphingomonas aurantiaca TaxID=185949 RepID=A0A5E8AHJ9_9SPHN|nr:hypothetical protein SPHINGO391_520051 [Sphingomonas aurantiaca]